MAKTLIHLSCILALMLNLIITKTNGLNKYCELKDTKELLNKFENCTRTGSMRLNTYSMSSSSSSSSSQSSSETITLKEHNDEILRILRRVLDAIDEGNSTKNESRHLFLDILRMVKIINSHSEFKYCISALCNLFKNCAFPINIEYKNFEDVAMVAARVAALLTAITYNEKLENKTYLTKANINSLMRLTVVDNDNIYDSKIAFFRNANQERFMFQASKNVETRSMFGNHSNDS